MKHNQLDKFIQELESIKMTHVEKTTMRNELGSFAVEFAPVVSPYQNMMVMAKRSFALAFVVVFSIASFSNAATKNSLPGDIFYPVKIAHEEIALATTVGSSKKITYEIRRTEKRIQEAAKLVQNDDFDNPTQQMNVAENIKKQTTKVKQHIEDIKNSDPEEALVLNSELKSAVKINQEVLRQVSSTSKNNIENIDIKPEVTDTLKATDTISPKMVPAQKIDSSKAVTTLSINTATNVETSFIDSLLESLDEEVESIEAYGDTIEKEILKKDTPTKEEVILKNDMHTEISVEETEDVVKEIIMENDTQSIELINADIKSLENIVDIKKSIQEIKVSKEIHIHTFTDISGIEQTFDEGILRKEADELIANKKYKQAFLKLQEILKHYQNEKITQKAEGNLGVNIGLINGNDTTKPTSPTTPSSTTSVIKQ